MDSTPLQKVLIEIVKELEETIVYLAAVETALVQNGVLREGEAGTHELEQSRKLTNVRSMISLLPV
jgi:hypothetical protein